MQKILEATDGVVAFLENIPLSSSSIKQYRVYLKGSIVRYCKANHFEIFSDKEMEAYVEEQMSLLKNGEVSKSTMVHRRKAAALLADYVHGRVLVWKHRSFKQGKLLDVFENTLTDYYSHLSESLAPRTIRGHIGIVRRFLVFIEDCSMQNFNKLTATTVKAFMDKAVPSHRGNVQLLTGAIKRFLAYLSDSGVASINADQYLVNPASRHRKLLPCFSDKEIDDILTGVDRSTPIGKRDYAILMIALWTGLRGVDILDLKRSHIDWDRKVINVVQGKTDVCIQAKLLAGVGNAIADYTLNARPESDSAYLFVRHRRPYERLSDCSVKEIMSRCLSNAGIVRKAGDGKSFHAFRRTFGTRLVRAGVPISSVAEMLGHTQPNSAKRYIALDRERLRVCCLDISKFLSEKVGLI